MEPQPGARGSNAGNCEWDSMPVDLTIRLFGNIVGLIENPNFDITKAE